uniref:Uncharacterized protein n=1 Tax=viral metagenome TaxID=1070528 RepID=A0A6M3JSN7_9ZZZZ
MNEFIKSVKEFREAFVIAVGDQSPFAKIALNKLDKAVEQIEAQQKDSADKYCSYCGCEIGDPYVSCSHTENH